ncbi:MAG: lysophospholipid acyltransferase family protein [Elusimicrobia bacterium]|nr:lysophospholipid acyltransferase family protein [Elusimicrobiota bacterium]
MNLLAALLLRVVLHGLGLAVAVLPRSWEFALGGALGRLALRVDPKRRKIAEENIARCLPELAPRERRLLLRGNYEHYGRLVLELTHMFTPIKGHFRDYAARVTVVEGYEHWLKAKARGKGVLFCSAHLANWELAASIGALKGIPVMIVTRRLKPPWLHDWMEMTRLSIGVTAAYQPRTIPSVMKALRDNGGVVFVMDQYMPPPMGEPTRFFGVLVDTLGAIATLARRTGAAILPVRQIREPDGRVRIVIEPEIELSGDDKSDNQRLAAHVEGWIRAVPEQWLWAHRRFKNVNWADRKTQAV